MSIEKRKKSRNRPYICLPRLFKKTARYDKIYLPMKKAAQSIRLRK